MPGEAGEAGGLVPPLVGMAVLECCLGYAVTLRLEGETDGAELRIEGAFTLRHPDGRVVSLRPEADAALLAEVLRLRFGVVTSAAILPSGELRLGLGNGVIIEAGPDADYENWELSWDSGKKALSLPGGGIATWGFGPPAAGGE